MSDLSQNLSDRSGVLKGKRGLIMGVANRFSISWAIAKAAWEAGADLAFTYQGERIQSRVEELAHSLDPKLDLILPCDVTSEDDMARVFDTLKERWGTFDFVVHGIAYADKDTLQGNYYDVSRAQFLQALDISCYSFTAVARLAAPLLRSGGSLLTLSYDASRRVIPGFYNLMGVAKAALETSVLYLAADLGPKKIRVNAISPGAIKTLAAAGIPNFQKVFDWAAKHSFIKGYLTGEDVAPTAIHLLSDGARCITGEIIYVDSGAHVALPKPEMGDAL